MSLRGDQGSATVFVTIMTVALVLVAGLVVDGGQILNASRQAANVAESAARAGAQALDEDATRREGTVVVERHGAIERARFFLTSAGYEGAVSVTNNTVVVTVRIRQPLLILGLGGLADAEVTGSGSAVPVRAIREP